MTSLLNLGEAEQAAEPKKKAPERADNARAESVRAPEVSSSQLAAGDEDFEIVLGRRQIASTGLLLTVAVAFFSGVSYLIGKSSAVKSPAPAGQAAETPQPATAAVPRETPPAPPATKEQAEKDQALKEPVQAAQPGTQLVQLSSAPLFAQEVNGETYLQVGVIEKGVAMLWAEGLRTHGLEAFVAPGPNDMLWRVVIGPLPNQQAYRGAKTELEKFGITAFGRVYRE